MLTRKKKEYYTKDLRPLQGKMSESQPIKRTRKLTNALIISATLNVAFLATLIYGSFKENPSHIAASLNETPHKKRQVHSDILQKMSNLTFHDLLFILSDKGQGDKREIALSALAFFHHFDIERALGYLPCSQTEALYTEKKTGEVIPITLYTDLDEYQYHTLIRFAKTEKWPFTTQGLFTKLKESTIPRDQTLLEALFITKEFHTIHTLFQRSQLSIKKQLLTELLLEGDWKTFTHFDRRLRQTSNFSETARREFLLTYCNNQSKIAARILYETDREYLEEKLSDEQIALVRNLLPKKKEAPPKKTVEKKSPPKPKPAQAPGFHIVQKGETLSQIAEMYNIPAEDLRFFNYLTSDTLRPGQELTIPEH